VNHDDVLQQITDKIAAIQETIATLRSTPPPSDWPPPLKVQVSVLCGPERHHWICPELTTAILAWSMDPRVTHPEGEFHYIPIFGKETSQLARNEACDLFLAGNCDYLLMVDNDTKPVRPTGELLSLMALADWGEDIVAAAVPTIAYTGGQRTWGINAYMCHGGGFRMLSHEELSRESMLRIDPDGRKIPLRELTDGAVGFGAVMLSRRVVEAMAHNNGSYAAGPLSAHIAAGPNETFAPILRSRDIRGATTFGEDLLFCWRARDQGFKSYVAPSMLCGHYHTVDFGEIPLLAPAIEPRPEQQKQQHAKPQEEEPTSYSIEDYGAYGLGNRPLPLPTITDWSIKPELAHALRQYITSRADFPHKPVRHVLELGSGISTVVMASALHGVGYRGAWLLSLEHDEQYVTATNKALTGDERTLCSVRKVGLGTDGFYTDWAHLIREAGCKFDLMLIDGPPGHSGGRVHADRMFPYLNDGAIIVLDDFKRPQENAALQTWQQSYALTVHEVVGRALVMTYHTS
jgi:predicted O-methyltransferase YrrM